MSDGDLRPPIQRILADLIEYDTIGLFDIAYSLRVSL